MDEWFNCAYKVDEFNSGPVTCMMESGRFHDDIAEAVCIEQSTVFRDNVNTTFQRELPVEDL